MAGEEKTEKATPKKRKDTRKKGEVLQSKEVAVAVFVVGIFAFLAIFGNYMFQMLLNFMEQSMSSIDKTGNTVEFAMSVFWKVAIICICTVGPDTGGRGCTERTARNRCRQRDFSVWRR